MHSLLALHWESIAAEACSAAATFAREAVLPTWLNFDATSASLTEVSHLGIQLLHRFRRQIKQILQFHVNLKFVAYRPPSVGGS